MNDPLAPLNAAVDALRGAWAGEDSVPAVAGPSVAGMSHSQLIAVNDALSAVSRVIGGLQARVAAEIARESRRELGPDSLAKQQGFRNPVALIAATTGTSTFDAGRLVEVGEATAPRTTLTGEAAPPRHPHVADALKSGSIGMPAASAIIRMLDRVAIRADRLESDRVEQILATQAAGLSLDQLAKVIARAEAHLDPDGLEPKERDARGARTLHIFERDGMIHINGKTDIESGAPIKLAIEALVTAEFRSGGDDTNGPDADLRSIPQRQADALTQLALHALGCEHDDLPLGGATVVVRMSLDDLTSGEGHATIDGIDQPISIAAARRMAAGGGVIPAVLGERGEVLDWGRKKRFFTKPQRLAFGERDGGCAGCGAPPGRTRAHHLNWWKRDKGRTDLKDGVLLCEPCHHRIHDNGWEILIEDSSIRSRVWFIPPAHVDPDRTPRLGGRARFDFDAELALLTDAAPVFATA